MMIKNTAASVKVAFLGLGKHSMLLAKAIKHCPHLEIAACHSICASEIQNFTEQFPCRSHNSIEALCADKHVEAVIIATPNHLHTEHCIQCAAAGKHIFIEKPISNTLEETEQIIDACESAYVTLAVGHQERRNGVYRTIKRMIDSGHLGQVYSFEANHCGNLLDLWPHDDWRFDSDHGTGPIFHKGIHKIDILNYLFGRPQSISTVSTALAFNPHMPETTISSIKYDNGLVGSLSTSFRYNNSSINIYGEKHSLRYSGHGPNLHIKNEAKWTVEEVTCEDIDEIAEELHEFSLAIRGLAKIEVDGQAAHDAMLFASAARLADERGRPVHLDEFPQLSPVLSSHGTT